MAVMNIKRNNIMKWASTFAILTILVCPRCCSVGRVNSENINLRCSNLKIKSDFEERTPLGTSKESVIEFIQNTGFVYYVDKNGDMETIGNSYVRAKLGGFGIFVKTSVAAFWEFDDNDRLERIRVVRTQDFL